MNDTVPFYENALFTSFIIPAITTVSGFLLMRFWYRKKEIKENNKLDLEISKISEDISIMKKSYQPLVLSTLQLTQQKLIDDKINTLREIINFRYNLFKLDQDYIDGEPLIDEMYQYHQTIYQNINQNTINNFTNFVLKNGYIFPERINNNFNLLIHELNEIFNIQKREFSKQNMNMPLEINDKLNRFSKKLNKVIDDIRLDLHIDNNFIHDFIKRYENLN